MPTIKPYRQVRNRVMDPTLLLVVHALLRGLFARAETLDDVLNKAHKRRDKVIQWKHPDYPIVRAI